MKVRRPPLSSSMIAVWAVVVGLFAWSIADAQRDSRTELEERFGNRVEMAVGQLQTYRSQTITRQRRLAREWLQARRVSGRDFGTAVAAAGHTAALLLDARGEVLRVAPHDPQVVGKRIAPEYPHLAAAVSGVAAVSRVVLSAARQQPIVAFAVPFDTPEGRRVFSSGYPVAKTPAGAFLRNSFGLDGGHFYLLDDSGQVMLSNAETTGDGTHDLLEQATGAPQGHFEAPDGERHYAQLAVPGTPWRVLLTVPEKVLYAPAAGTSHWLPWLVLALLAGGSLVGMNAVRLRMAAERRLAQAAALHRASLQNMPGSAIFVFDRDLRFTLVEGPAVAHTSHPTRELWVGRTLSELVPAEHLPAVRGHYDAALRGETRSFEWTSPATGHIFDNTISPLVDEDGEIWAGLVTTRDVTERRQLERKLRDMAERDSLTGLYNRRHFEERLAGQVARCRRHAERAALLLLDLDHFKDVNDTHGHGTGDELIKHVARTLDDRARASDTVARLGGDEFAVLLSHVSPDQAARVAQSIAEALRERPLTLADGRVIEVTASTGIAFLAASTAGVEQALADADVAMYDAKAAGRDRISGLRTVPDTPTSETIRVAHCDDSEPYRSLLVEMMRAHPDIELVAEAATAAGAVEVAGAITPDVVLLDASLADGDPHVADKLRAVAPDVRIVLLSGLVDCPTDVLAGCDAFVSKSQTFDAIAQAVRDGRSVSATV